MPWVHPTSQFFNGSVVDWLEWAENLAAYASIIDGGLNEHNFASTIGSTLSAAGKVAQNVAVRAFQTARQVDITGATSGFTQVPNTENWYAITESEVEFGWPGGDAFVCINGQAKINNIVSLYGPGLQFCIELDGASQFSSLNGSGDLGNDLLTNDDVVTELLMNDSSGSLKGGLFPFSVSGVFTLDAGAHTVRLLVRNPYTLRSGAQQDQYVANVETIILAGWC